MFRDRTRSLITFNYFQLTAAVALLLSAAFEPHGLAAVDSSTYGRPPSDALYRNPALPVETRVLDLMTRMTQEEKIGQLSQGFTQSDQPETYAAEIISGKFGSYILTKGEPLASRLQHLAVDQTRTGIPLIFGFDTIHGYRTVFPISLGLSCAWDPALFEKCQSMAARESRADGVQWVFAPMSDLARDPRWGRVAETCGEDPYLVSQCVGAEVRGFQGGSLPDEMHVAACLKHFVGYSASIGGRDYNATEIPEFILRNFHLPPFHAGVNAGALTVMSSFNANDGIPGVANTHTLSDILRGEWGFRGFVVSDWDAVEEQIRWGYAENRAAAARMALQAGTDMEMISDTYRESLADQVLKGRLSQKTVDEAVQRILTVKFKLGLFEHPYPAIHPESATMSASAALAREAAQKSVVLLKNEDALPLRGHIGKIALIGPFGADGDEMLGSWPGHGKSGANLAEAIRARLPSDAHLVVLKGCDIADPRDSTDKSLNDGTTVEPKAVGMPVASGAMSEAVKAASEADTIILALGEPAAWSGEDGSRATLGVTGRQQELFNAVARLGKRIIVILFCGRPLAVPVIVSHAAALLVAWQPGVEGGNGITDLLFGDISPSGRLTMSFPVDAGQLPVYYNYYNTGRPASGTYRDMSREPLYSFGHGLTYTTFAYDRVSIRPAQGGQPAFAETTITNTGSREGLEVAQLYIHGMACSQGARPVQELRGFQRLNLKPQESRTLSFPLTSEVLGFVGRDGKWCVEAGDYKVWIAPEAHSGVAVLYRHAL